MYPDNFDDWYTPEVQQEINRMLSALWGWLVWVVTGRGGDNA